MHSIKESLESIAFQLKSDYPSQLAQAFQKCIDAQGMINVIDIALGDIRELTCDTTGIWMEPVLMEPGFLEGDYMVSCVTENLNALSPINMAAVSKLAKYDLASMRAEQILDGTVDLRNAKVTGFFTKIKNRFNVSPSMFGGLFTAWELVGLYLHEVGHAWVTYEYLGQTLITNTIIAEVLGVYNSDLPLARRYEVGRAAVKLSGNPADVPADADMTTIVALVLQGQPRRMADRVGSRWYDQRLAEALSDQFAARWLVGAPLVTAIGKMQRSRGILAARGYDPKWFGLVSNFLNIISLPFGLVEKGAGAVAIATAKSLATTAAIGGSIQMLLHLMSGGKYDAPKTRIDAIRRETVTLLKDRRLDDVVRKQLLADLEVIDKEKASIHSYGDVLSRATDWLIQKATGRANELGANDLSEDLANNRLFELAARLKG